MTLSKGNIAIGTALAGTCAVVLWFGSWLISAPSPVIRSDGSGASTTEPRSPTPSTGAGPTARPVDLNIIVLLDLSDRISPALHPRQADRDKQIVRTLVDLFEARVRSRLFVASRDRLRIAIAKQEGSGYEPSQFADAMSIDMRAIFQHGRPAFDRHKARLLAAVDELYAAATQSTRYTGANIPLFFRDHVRGYIEATEPGRALRNVLFVLTDGYIALDGAVRARLHDEGHRTTDMRLAQFRGLPNWERVFDAGDHGLIVPERGLCNGLEVAVLEINLDPQHQDDKKLLFKYWRKWLTEMGCAKTDLALTEDASSQTASAIARFLATP